MAFVLQVRSFWMEAWHTVHLVMTAMQLIWADFS